MRLRRWRTPFRATSAEMPAVVRLARGGGRRCLGYIAEAREDCLDSSSDALDEPIAWALRGPATTGSALGKRAVPPGDKILL